MDDDYNLFSLFDDIPLEEDDNGVGEWDINLFPAVPPEIFSNPAILLNNVEPKKPLQIEEAPKQKSPLHVKLPNPSETIEAIQSTSEDAIKPLRRARSMPSRQPRRHMWSPLFYDRDDDSSTLPSSSAEKRCSRCKTTETPQWKGPNKTLCDICGDIASRSNPDLSSRKKGGVALGSSSSSSSHSKAKKECSHCGQTETPLWRMGPNGPWTLCNACGLRYRKYGDSFCEHYRPASSPNFNPSLHSNLQSEVIKMRNRANERKTQDDQVSETDDED